MAISSAKRAETWREKEIIIIQHYPILPHWAYHHDNHGKFLSSSLLHHHTTLLSSVKHKKIPLISTIWQAQDVRYTCSWPEMDCDNILRHETQAMETHFDVKTQATHNPNVYFIKALWSYLKYLFELNFPSINGYSFSKCRLRPSSIVQVSQQFLPSLFDLWPLFVLLDILILLSSCCVLNKFAYQSQTWVDHKWVQKL